MMSQHIEPRMRPRPPPPPPPPSHPPPSRKTSRKFELASRSFLDLSGSLNNIAEATALSSSPASGGGIGRRGQKALMPRSPLVYAGEEIGADLNGGPTI